MNRLTDTVKHLIIINVIMFIGTTLVGEGKLFTEWFAMYFPKNDAFQPWQIFTHMFMHGDVMHIFFNMFTLFMFGTAVEHYLGTKKFLFLYISSGLGAVALHVGYAYFNFNAELSVLTDAGFRISDVMDTLKSGYGTYDRRWTNILVGDRLLEFVETFNAPMLGASGCIMGVMAAFGVMNPNAKLMMIFLPIPIKAKYFIPGIIILDIISAISGKSFFSPSNTAYMAHVGGAIVGFLIMWYWKKNSFNKYRVD
ncbi:rhomboid family intramembrane serine protease [Pontimicrobium sp. MEBiC01747]